MRSDNSSVLEVTKERLIPGRAPEWDLAFHTARYTFAQSYATEKMVLDCACGVGYGSQMIANAKARRVYGVDLSLAALRYAVQNFSAPRLVFSNQNAMALGFPAAVFDLVISFETIEHLRQPELFLASVTRFITPDGLFITSVPNKDALSSNLEVDPSVRFSPFHEREYSLVEFQDLLKLFFRQIEFYYQLCPDQKLLRARQLNRIARRSHLTSIKRFLPQRILELLRLWRNYIGDQANQRVSADYYAPRPISEARLIEDAFVIVAVCRSPRTLA